MGDVFNSGIPCPSINEDRVKHVIFLKGPNPMICLFDYLTVWICPSLLTKDMDTQALACIYEREMKAKITKKKKNLLLLLLLSSIGDMVNLSVFSSTFYPLTKWEAEK